VSPDPDYQMYNMYHEQGAGANHGHYWSDPEAMDLIEEATEGLMVHIRDRYRI
jgi:ABC-type transport system substrate-binding protein